MGFTEMINSVPLGIWWLVAGLAVLLVYLFALNDEQKVGVNGFMKKYTLWVFVILLFFWGRSNWGFWVETDTAFHFSRKSDTFIVIASLAIGWSIQFLGKLRYLSTQAVCDNRSGSCADYQEVGEYTILNIGTVDADMFPWYHGHETWIIPTRHFRKINGSKNMTKAQIIIATLVDKVDITELSSECQDYIESSSTYNKENIYYGEFSMNEIRCAKDKNYKVDIDGVKLDLNDYATKLKDTQRLLNESRQMVKGKTKAILGFMSHNNEIQKKARGSENTRQDPPAEY